MKHRTRYLTQRQFNQIMTTKIDDLRRAMLKLRKMRVKGFRYKQVWVKPHTVPKYRTHGHYMRVLVKAKAA